MISQYSQKPSKWCLETSKLRSQEVPETIKINKKPKTWNLMKTIVFTVFLRGWDIRNQQIFASENHQESCLQSKPTFWHLKAHKITESDSKVSPMGDPKSIKNRLKFTLGHPRVLLSAPLQQMTAKVMPKCLLRTSKCSKNGFSRPLKINKCVCNRAWS